MNKPECPEEITWQERLKAIYVILPFKSELKIGQKFKIQHKYGGVYTVGDVIEIIKIEDRNRIWTKGKINNDERWTTYETFLRNIVYEKFKQITENLCGCGKHEIDIEKPVYEQHREWLMQNKIE